MAAEIRSTGAYARLWRWHFYAAFLVIPFVLWQGTSGLVVLWSQEIGDALWPALRVVQPAEQPASLDAQRAAAQALAGSAAMRTIRVSADPRRSTEFLFDTPGGLPQPVYVDPGSGAALGAIPASHWLPGLTRKLHGGWPLGDPGSWLLELGAGWALAMALSGVYLWWPRGRKGLAGTLYPRLRGGTRVFWRDVHAVAGVWIAGLLVLFLLTALPWTAFWGEQILRPLQRASGQAAPAALNPMLWSTTAAGPDLPLQRVVEIARAEGLAGTLEIQPRAHPLPVTVTERRGRASEERVLQIDRVSGEVRARVGWADYASLPRIVATGVDLHEGTFLGRANQWLNTALVLTLYWLAISGAIGWYRRRPAAGLGAPPRSHAPLPASVRAGAVGVCVLMPLLGLSVLLLAAFDAAWLAFRRSQPA